MTLDRGTEAKLEALSNTATTFGVSIFKQCPQTQCRLTHLVRKFNPIEDHLLRQPYHEASYPWSISCTGFVEFIYLDLDVSAHVARNYWQ